MASLVSTQKQHNCPTEDADVDRISSLPESIISDILSLLPTKNAVATSLLSKGWRFHWTNVTSFDFDDHSVEFDKVEFVYSDESDDSDESNNDDMPNYEPSIEPFCLFCPVQKAYPMDSDLHWDVAEETNFVEFVENVLNKVSLLKSDKFRLRCRSPDLLRKWVNSAIDRNVRFLDLATTPRAGSMSSLPDALYTSATLEVLKLVGPIQLRLPQVVSLPKLTVLELNKVIYKSDASFCQLISGCPVLQSLTIKRIAPMFQLGGPRNTVLRDNLVYCTISSPSLRRLQIYFEYETCQLWRPAFEHTRSEYCRLGMSHISGNTRMKLEINAPVLEYVKLHDDMSSKISMLGPNLVNEVDLDVLCEYWNGYYDLYRTKGKEGRDYDDASFPHDRFYKYNVVVDLVDTFSGVQFMKLGRRTMKALKKGGSIPLYKCFERLTKLVIQDERCEWSTLVDLIGNCARLEVLDICDDKGGILEWFNPHAIFVQEVIDIDTDVPGCLSTSLKHVTVRRFAGYLKKVGYLKKEMAMLHFFLKHGLVMERLNVCFDKSIDSNRRCDILNEVSKFNRKSPNCEISECDDSEEEP